MKKIAIVRLDKIGDLILTTPAIASLKILYPDCRLTAIVNRYNRDVLENSPHVDEIWEWEWTRKNIQKLRNAHFDVIVVFSPTTSSYSVALLSGTRIRVGYTYGSRILTRLFILAALNKRLLCSIDQKDLDREAQKIPHEVEQNLELITELGLPSNKISEDLVVPLRAENLTWAKEVVGKRPSIGVHASQAWQSNLPMHFLSNFFSEVSKQYAVFFTYGPAESLGTLPEVSPDLRDTSGSVPKGVKRFWNLTFSRWGALLHQAKVVVTTNTGAVHLAASQGVPVIAVFEPEFFAYHRQRWAPWKVPSLILRKDDPKLLEKLIEGTLTLANTKKNIGSNLQL